MAPAAVQASMSCGEAIFQMTSIPGGVSVVLVMLVLVTLRVVLVVRRV
jgi:hypothetical protein